MDHTFETNFCVFHFCATRVLRKLSTIQVGKYCQFCSLCHLKNITLLLPPATKFGQGNIFSSVCQEFCPRVGVPWQVHPPGRYSLSPRQVHPPGQEHPSPLGRYTPPGRYPPPWSMSRRYASYWNAFLFPLTSNFTLTADDVNKEGNCKYKNAFQ